MSTALLRTFQLAIVACCAALFACGAWVGATAILRDQHLSILRDRLDGVIRSTETAVAQAGAALDELAREGWTDCRDGSLQAIRLRVYQTSVIKDVRLTGETADIRCSAYSETLEFDRSWVSPADMLTGQDGSGLFRVEQFTADALGLFRLRDGTGLVAIIGVDPLRLDVLPRELRDHGSVELQLANGTEIGRFAAPGATAGAATGEQVGSASALFPIRAVLRLKGDALDDWAAPPPTIPLAGAMLGLAFGFMAARSVGRPLDPVTMLDRAIAAREFVPFYQPIFALGTREIVGCEVLMRWRKPDGRLVPPSAFIPLAESSGRIERMTWLLLDAALLDLRAPLAVRPGLKVSVNVAPRQFLAGGFADAFAAAVAASGVRPQQVVIEVTERDELEDLGRACSVVDALRARGIRVALDDVGVGHSGLSYIQRLRPDLLKVDKFFVDSLGSDGTAAAVVGMLVRLAGELGMGVVAEGVETEQQARAALACGVREAQGYLVSPPVPAPAFLALLAASPAARPQPCALAA